MAKNDVFVEQERQGNQKSEFSLVQGPPGRIKVSFVSKAFSTNPTASINFKIERSFNGGLTWTDPQGFVTSGGYDSKDSKGDKCPYTIFNWDGKACKYRANLTIPVKFSFGLQFEVL